VNVAIPRRPAHAQAATGTDALPAGQHVAAVRRGRGRADRQQPSRPAAAARRKVADYGRRPTPALEEKIQMIVGERLCRAAARSAAGDCRWRENTRNAGASAIHGMSAINAAIARCFAWRARPGYRRCRSLLEGARARRATTSGAGRAPRRAPESPMQPGGPAKRTSSSARRGPDQRNGRAEPLGENVAPAAWRTVRKQVVHSWASVPVATSLAAGLGRCRRPPTCLGAALSLCRCRPAEEP